MLPSSIASSSSTEETGPACAKSDGSNGTPTLTTRQVADCKHVTVGVIWAAVNRGELTPLPRSAADAERRGYRFSQDQVDTWIPPCDRAPPVRYTDDFLLQHLQLLADDLGRTPRASDLNVSTAKASSTLGRHQGNDGPSPITYRRRFGSWDGALVRAGLIESLPSHHTTPHPSLSDDDLIDILHELASRIGRLPTWADARSSPDCPHPSTFARRFGSWSEALIQAFGEAAAQRRGKGRIDDDDVIKHRPQLA